MMSSFVRAGPISRTIRGTPPQAKGSPSSTSGMKNTASSATTRRSQAAISRKPPPTAYPWTWATVSARIRSSASIARRPSWPASRRWRQFDSEAPPIAFRSAPAQKARPSPRSTTTSTSLRSSNQAAARASSRSIAPSTAFRRSGRAKVRKPRLSRLSTFRVSKSFVLPMCTPPPRVCRRRSGCVFPTASQRACLSAAAPRRPICSIMSLRLAARTDPTAKERHCFSMLRSHSTRSASQAAAGRSRRFRRRFSNAANLQASERTCP